MPSLRLFACGKSEAIKNAEVLIGVIGEVTVDSGDIIDSAQTAYDSLSEKEEAEVDNYAVLILARVDHANDVIDPIGEVTLDSEAAILNAEKTIIL